MATGIVPAVDLFHGSDGVSQELVLIRAHHQVLDPLLIAIRGTQEVSGMEENKLLKNREALVGRT